MSSNAFFQNSWYIGNNFNWILYGVYLVLYAQTMHIYASESTRRSSARFFTSFGTVMLVLITIYVVVQSITGEEIWIANADYPGGSAAWFAVNASIWYQTMGTMSSIMLQLLSDGLWIHRCLVLWGDWKIVILPSVLWLAALAFGIFNLYVSGSPNSNFFTGFAAHIGVNYVATSIGLNVLVTSLTSGRILFYSHRLRKQFGLGITETSFSSATIVIESVLLYTLCGIAFVVSYGMNSEITILFLSLYAMFIAISPQVLILRVASGRAWDTNTATRAGMTTLQFVEDPDPTRITTVSN